MMDSNPRTSGLGNFRSANWVATIALLKKMFKTIFFSLRPTWTFVTSDDSNIRCYKTGFYFFSDVIASSNATTSQRRKRLQKYSCIIHYRFVKNQFVKFFKLVHSQSLFLYFRRFKSYLKIAVDWNWTCVLWC